VPSWSWRYPATEGSLDYQNQNILSRQSGRYLPSTVSRGNKPTARLTRHVNDFTNAKSNARKKPLLAGWRHLGRKSGFHGATTSWKNVETLARKNDLSCFKSLLVTGLWDMILTSHLPPIQSCSSKFWVSSCIASSFDKGWRGDRKHKIMDRPFMRKYGTVSQVLLQLVVAQMARQAPKHLLFWLEFHSSQIFNWVEGDNKDVPS